MNRIRQLHTTQANFNSLNFNDLKKINTDQIPIEIRGFLYRTQEDQLILAPQPNLKTCCIGNPDQLSQQIIISSGTHLPNTQAAVTLQGYLSKRNNKHITFYQLHEAKIVENDTHTALYVIFAVLTLCIALYVALKPILVPKAARQKASDGPTNAHPSP